MSEGVDTIVIGAGVVGLAVARAVALRGREVVVVESEATFGVHASSRNSEVIHAGIYYPPGSLKARLCVRGREQLYAYCEARDIAHRRCGKLIVAADEQQCDGLRQLQRTAAANGVSDLEWLDGAAIRAHEPELAGCGALWSPQTGIVDGHGFMRTLLADAEAHGTMVAWQTSVRGIHRVHGGYEVDVGDDRIVCTRLINAAGAGAQTIAETLPGAAAVPPRFLAKGTYARLEGPHPFETLVYPTPATASLGVHLTLDLGGQARFGPDQQWVDTVDYEVDPDRIDSFYPAIRRYWPALPDDSLHADYAGVRVKVQAPGSPMADFAVHGPSRHGLRGLVHLFGIESPGLTSALALADAVVHELGL